MQQACRWVTGPELEGGTPQSGELFGDAARGDAGGNLIAKMRAVSLLMRLGLFQSVHAVAGARQADRAQAVAIDAAGHRPVSIGETD
jgi:hypothetical protein